MEYVGLFDMNLPFLNRKRYIVLKFYTPHQGVFERAKPVTDFHRAEAYKGPAHEANFSSCMSRIAAKKNSVTVPSPVDFLFRCDGEIVHFDASDTEVLYCDFSHDGDRAYGSNKDFVIAKMVMPWRIEEDSGVNFVVARHMMNRTMMNVLSGVISFNATASSSFFNVINKTPHEYHVGFGEPLVSYFPMSDKPVHVECYCDPDKYRKMREIYYSTHFRAKAFKQLKSR